MSSALAFIPQDRRQALATGRTLPDVAVGVVLFADISGFTPLTNAYIDSLGPQRGVEAATRGLNVVYAALIAVLDAWGGTVVGFSGDGMACWFGPVDEAMALTDLAQTALHAAAALHEALVPYRMVQVDDATTVELGIKIALAGGQVRRFVAGDPAIQLVDVIGGLPVDLTGMGEQMAERGETLVAASLLPYLSGIPTGDRRVRDGQTFVVIPHTAIPHPSDHPAVSPFNRPPSNKPLLDLRVSADQVRPWLLPHVASRLAFIDERFWAELRPGVALFVRFTGLDYDHDPEVVRLLDSFIRRVQAIVHRLEGALLQVTTGDKGSYLYAAFGATKTHADDALRAVAAAVEILHDEAARGQVKSMQIGLAAGRMRTGAYGGPTRRTFGAQGAAVNLAARLMMAAPVDAIVVTDAIAAAVQERFDVAFHADLTLKGMSTPVPVYQVIGPRTGRVQAALPENPLVGREAELAQLEAALRRTQTGAGAWIELTGPAGSGKSALLHACAALAEQMGLNVIHAEADAIRGHVAYQAVGDLLRRSLAVCAGIDLSGKGAEPLSAWVAQTNPAWLPRLPLLRDLLDLDLPHTPVTLGLTAELRQAALASLLGELFAALAAQQPLLLLVDNGQWLDEASQAVLAQMGVGWARQPILLLTALRADAVQHGREMGPLRIHVDDLPPSAMAQLVAHLLPPDVDPLIVGLINRVAQGNPYMAGETAAFLRTGGHLQRKAGQWRLADDYAATLRAARILVYDVDGWSLAPEAEQGGALPGVPDSLHGLLLARFDRLPDPAKLTLKIASVIGRRVETSLLAAVHPAGADARHLHDHLALLVQGDVLEPVPRDESAQDGGAQDDGALEPAQVAFRHNLMQEVVYNTLLHSQQQELHAALAQVIEARTPQAVERLAHHFGAADLADAALRDKAIRYMDLAAAKHEREFANETALQLLTRLIALAPSWPVAARQLRLLHVLGRREEELAALAAARQWQAAAGYELPLWESRYHEQMSNYDAAWQAAENALTLAPPNDVAGRVECLVQQANVAGRKGDYAVEAARYQAALALMDDAQVDDPALSVDLYVDLYYGLGIVYRKQGQFDESIRALLQALQMAQAEGLLIAEAKVRTALGFTALQQRRFDFALEHTEAALHLRRMIGDRRGEGASLSSLAQVLIHGFGDTIRAREMLLEALALQRSIGNRWSMILNLNELGILHLLIGQYAVAEGYLREGLTLCREIGTTAGTFYINLNLGIVLREQGNLDDADVCLAAALDAAKILDDPQTAALVRSEIALAALAREDWATARQEAAAVCAILDELDLKIMSTPDLTTQGRAALAVGDRTAAAQFAQAAWQILLDCNGQGPDVPQRDAYFCAMIFAALGDHDRARQALDRARTWLEERAARILDADLRAAYRREIPVHAAILAATDSDWLLAAADTSRPRR